MRISDICSDLWHLILSSNYRSISQLQKKDFFFFATYNIPKEFTYFAINQESIKNVNYFFCDLRIIKETATACGYETS